MFQDGRRTLVLLRSQVFSQAARELLIESYLDGCLGLGRELDDGRKEDGRGGGCLMMSGGGDQSSLFDKELAPISGCHWKDDASTLGLVISFEKCLEGGEVVGD